MKGTIVKCLEEVIKRDHDEEKWEEILEAAGIDPFHIFGVMDDVADEGIVAVIGKAAEVLGVPAQKIMDDFGVHWSAVYAPRVYEVYFEKATSTRQMLLSMAGVHEQVTRRMDNARPPRFTYDETEDGITMHYDSPRGLVALMPGLVRGLAQYFNEEVEVDLSGNAVKVHFLSAKSRKVA